MKRQYKLAIKAFLFLLFFSAGSASSAFSQQGIITTFAGGGPNSPSALSADINPQQVVVDASGNLFFTGAAMHQVFKVDPAGNFTVVAGTGAAGFSGDGGPATNASLNFPDGIAVDDHGNILIGDSGNSRVRRVDGVTGIITTVAGNGQAGFGGDGGPATSANLNQPNGVAVDSQGNLFVVDFSNMRIRRVDAVTGIITTVTGTGTAAFTGDGGPAASASIFYPSDLAVDGQDNLFIVEDDYRIRRVDGVTGIITTYAGNGARGYSGEGGPATSAQLASPAAVAVDAHGNLFIADGYNLRRVDAATQIITTVAGNGQSGFSGDGGAAKSASFTPLGVAVDAQGNLFIADIGSGRIRGVEATSGIINTVAGGGSGGDGGAATSAILDYPAGVALDGSSNVFIADYSNQRIRRVEATTGIITTAAGTGIEGYGGDGGPSTSARLWFPFGVAVDPQGNLFIADSNNGLIRRVDAQTGIINTVAGKGNGGDGGLATNASLGAPFAVALDAERNIFIVESGYNRIRRVDDVTGIITTVAGNGTPGYGGDGGPAASASLDLEWGGGAALDAHGNLFIADVRNNRVRRVDAKTGIITTVAGTGQSSSSGDGGPATSAALDVQGVAVDTQGNLFIAGVNVRRVDAVTGIITTVAGSNHVTPSFGGDGGPATGINLGFVLAVALDAQGRLFIADTSYNRVRVVPLPPFVALSTATLLFPKPVQGPTSAAQTVRLTNTGLVPLTISSLAIGGTNPGNFAETNTCGSSLVAGANCSINVTFTPTAAGSSSATLTITDNAPGSPHTVLLSGTTQPADFSLAVSGSSASATVTAGQTATYTLSLTPQGNLTGTVSLACSGAPSQSSCTVNPPSVNLTGSGSATAIVTATAAAHLGPRMRMPPPEGPWIWILWLGLLAAVGAALTREYRFIWRRAWLPLGAAMLGLILWAGCGGGGGGGPGAQIGPAPGTYTLTVTATLTSGATKLQHNVSLTLTVN